jgi:hypothetical protein
MLKESSHTGDSPRSRGVWVPDRRSLALICPGRRGTSFRFNFQTVRGCASAFSRRDAPELCFDFRPQETRGRRESRVRAAPAVSRAKGRSKKRTRAYRFSGGNPAFPAQWFYGLLRALPGDRAFWHRRPRKVLLPANLNTSVGVSEPHGFTVRSSHARQSQLSRPSHPTARS